LRPIFWHIYISNFTEFRWFFDMYRSCVLYGCLGVSAYLLLAFSLAALSFGHCSAPTFSTRVFIYGPLVSMPWEWDMSCIAFKFGPDLYRLLTTWKQSLTELLAYILQFWNFIERWFLYIINRSLSMAAWVSRVLALVSPRVGLGWRVKATPQMSPSPLTDIQRRRSNSSNSKPELNPAHGHAEAEPSLICKAKSKNEKRRWTRICSAARSLCLCCVPYRDYIRWLYFVCVKELLLLLLLYR
jgi:hypothetical protein